MNRIPAIWILALLFFSSCTVYREYAIDVYKPGETALPGKTNHIALLSRNFKYSSDTLRNYYRSDYRLRFDKENSRINLDSIAAMYVLQGAAETLSENPAVANVQIFPYSTFKPHKGEKLAEITPEILKSLAGSLNADALVLLDVFSFFYNEYKSPEITDTPSNEVITAAVWSFYDVGKAKISERKTLIDTIYWDNSGAEGKGKNVLPTRLEAIKLAAGMAGAGYASRFSPSWQKVYRMYAIPPVEDFRLAAGYFVQNEFDKAIGIWEKYSFDEYRKLAILARYNLALAYEMSDDIGNAISRINEALALAISIKSRDEIKMALLYKNVLEERQKDFLLLQQQ